MTEFGQMTAEKKLLNILEATRAGTWEWNVQTGQTIFNERWAEIIGYSLTEISPTSIETWKKYTHPEDLEKSGELLKKHFSGDVAFYECEVRMKHKEGHWVWVLDRGKVYSWTKDGQPLWMFGTHIDITERKKAELDLVESEERFRALSDASFGGVVIHDNGLILDCNQGLADMTGFSRQELIGMDGLKLIEPKSLDTVIHNIKNNFQQRYEVEGVRKDGSVYPLSIKGKNVPYQGREVRVIEFFDLTEAKSSEARFQDIAESMGDWIWEVDTQGTYTFSSEKVTNILGYQAGEIIGRTPFDLMPEDQIESFRAFFNSVLQSQKPFRDYENWNYHKDGHLVCLSTSGTPIFSKDGSLTGFRGVDKDITEKKRSEELIKLNEQRYRNIVENTEDLITRVDTHGSLLYVNPSSQRYWGMSPEECKGKLAFDFVHPEDRQLTEESFQAWLNSKEDYVTFENRQVHVANKSTTLLWTISATRNTDGEIIEFTGIARDIEKIRQEKQVQKALLHLIEYSTSHSVEELLKELLQQAEKLTGSEIGFYHLVDEEANQILLQVWSKNTLEKSCTAESDISHYPISEAGLWADSIRQRKPVIHNDYAGLLHKQGLPEGHVTLVREIVIPVLRGDKIVAVLGVGNKQIDYNQNDIKKVQRLADLAWEIVVRKQAEHALMESEERFQKMFRSHDAVMLMIDSTTGKIIDANDSALAYYGYSLDEFRALTIQEINSLSDEEVEKARKKATDREQSHFEFKHRLSSGEIRDIEVHVSRIELNRQPILFSIIHDITQRKRLMEEQSRSAQLAALGTVAAGVAHEINNPIQGIMNYASLIRMKPANEERNQEIAKRIFNESKRIAEITQNLLYYSKDSRIDLKKVDISETIEGALSLISTKIRNSGIRLEKKIQDHLPQVMLQPQSIQQVVLNLIDNAYDALRYKGITADSNSIKVLAGLCEEDDGKHIFIEVYDNGIGMSEDLLEKSQEAFFTTKPPSEGTGLGLSIVDDIVKKHNGQIVISSREGEYTSIKVILPVEQDINHN